MKTCIAVTLVILGAGYWQPAATETLYSNNGIPWRGEIGPVAYCPGSSPSTNGSFAYALDFKYEELNVLDFIGGDSVMLYCRDDEGMTTGYISSLQGSNGEWQGIGSCPGDEFFTGFRLRVFPEQGTWGDDFAVDNIQLACSDGTVVDGLEGVLPDTKDKDEVDDSNVTRRLVMLERQVEELRYRLGSRGAKLNGQWGTWANCSPGLYVSGIQTVVEEGHVGDDAGLTDVIIYCS